MCCWIERKCHQADRYWRRQNHNPWQCIWGRSISWSMPGAKNKLSGFPQKSMFSSWGWGSIVCAQCNHNRILRSCLISLILNPIQGLDPYMKCYIGSIQLWTDLQQNKNVNFVFFMPCVPNPDNREIKYSALSQSAAWQGWEWKMQYVILKKIWF